MDQNPSGQTDYYPDNPVNPVNYLFSSPANQFLVNHFTAQLLNHILFNHSHGANQGADKTADLPHHRHRPF